jgi:hypothetical protein
MARLDEIISEQFRRFEQRGRGWRVHDFPVPPEPPFRPFSGYHLPPVHDDGRRPTALSSLLETLQTKFAPRSAPPPVIVEAEKEPEATLLERDPLSELQTVLPANLDIDHDAFAAFLEQLSVCAEPIAFELLADTEDIAAQFVAHPRDVPIMRR